MKTDYEILKKAVKDLKELMTTLKMDHESLINFDCDDLLTLSTYVATEIQNLQDA